MALEKRLIDLYAQEPFDTVLSEIMEVQLGLNLEVDEEEIFWAQRAWVNWLQNGDKNTSFFHKMGASRYYRNRIVGLEDENGRWVSQMEDLLHVALKYFGNIFTASAAGGDDRLLGLVKQRISASMNDELL
ncbi:hypothetical protein PVK06_028696 [Gossypium arboreum]|uniref:Uncharacterized protein n=1 Tax=Gossypium arboreum TaxID=29729 RepID=A0ABR0P4K4_GOSAR|nr:hypothetical protein PVK06_028696 [Gossypium arboreum]